MNTPCVIPWTTIDIGHNYVECCCYKDEQVRYGADHVAVPSWGLIDAELSCWNHPYLVGLRARALQSVNLACGEMVRCVPVQNPHHFDHIGDAAPGYFDNLALCAEEFHAGATRLSSKPVSYGIQIGKKCALRCIMCFEDFGTVAHVGSIPLDKARALHEMARYARHWDLQGGEVFLEPDSVLDYMIPSPDEHPQLISSLTTAFGGVTEERFRKWAPRLRTMAVSIDSCDPTVYESIRRGAGFGHLMRMLVVARELGKLDTVNMVLMDRNLDQLADMVRFASSQGFRVLQLLRTIEVGLVRNGLDDEDLFCSRRSRHKDARLVQRWTEMVRAVSETGITLQDSGVGNYLRQHGYLRDRDVTEAGIDVVRDELGVAL